MRVEQVTAYPAYLILSFLKVVLNALSYAPLYPNMCGESKALSARRPKCSQQSTLASIHGSHKHLIFAVRTFVTNK